MNPELWKLLTSNNNCLVSTSNRTNKNTKQIENLKSELCLINRRFTKNILGDGTSGPTDGLEGGIEQRPCPANGDEWVDPVTGTRYIFQGCAWHLVPCCTQFTGPADVDQVTVFENGVEAPFRLVAAPLGQTGKFTWCQTGAAGEIGEWVNEDLYDAANFLGTGPVGTPVGIQNGMPRAPINGDQWYKLINGITPGERSVSYIYQNNAWVEAPCCASFQPPVPASPENNIGSLFIGEIMEYSLVQPPGQTGKFIWCQDDLLASGRWVNEDLYDAANFLGTGPVGTPVGIQNGMPRAPINGDQWYKNIMDGLTPQRSVSYVYQNNAWVEAPCCVGFQPAIGFPDSDVGLLYFGESPITRQIVVPPSATGIFVWNQYTLGVGSWTAATDFDAANFIGVGASGLTAGSLPVGALDGMTRPPINGDQWYNVLDAGSTAERSIDFIYKNGGWTGVPCCVAYDDPSVVTNNIGTVYVGGDPAHKVVQPPTENTGTYLWQQNVTGPTSEGLWVPATSPYVSLVNTGATADIGATGNLPYILIGSSFTGANAISFTSISDNSTLFNGTDTIIINEPGDYLITTNMLIFGTLNSSTGVYSVFASVYVNDMLNDQIVPYVSLNSISLGIIFTNNIVFSNTLQLNNSDTLKLGYYTQIVGSGTGINIYTASMQIKKFAI